MREDECYNRGLLLFADVERAIYLSCNQSNSVDGCVVGWDDWIDHAEKSSSESPCVEATKLRGHSAGQKCPFNDPIGS